MVRKKYCNASTVVEMAYIMPLVLTVWVLVIFALLYYHDKNILAGASYETAVVGSELFHEKGEIDEENMEGYFQQRIRGKLLFFGTAFVEIQGDDKQISVKATASGKGMEVFMEKCAALSIPEKKIRESRVLKQRMQEVIQ